MERGGFAPEEQFLLLSTIFYYLMLYFYVKTRIRFSLRDKRLFEIIEVELMRVDCISTIFKLRQMQMLVIGYAHAEFTYTMKWVVYAVSLTCENKFLLSQ